MRRLCCFLGSLAAWPAELVMRNGRLWTGEKSKPWANTVLIRDEKIVAAGTEAEVKPGPGATVIDAKGRLVTPGFNDAHVHFLSGALGPREIDITGICTLETIQKAVGEFVAKNPGPGWVNGRGWEYRCFPGGKLPL